MRRITPCLAALTVTLLSTAAAQAAITSFSDWQNTPIEQDNFVYTLIDYSSNLADCGVSTFTNSAGNPQMNTWPVNYLLNVQAGDYFEYTIQAKPGYAIDWAVMSYNALQAPMTTTITAGADSWVLTQPANPSHAFDVDQTLLTVRNDFGAGQIAGSSHTNAFGECPEPASLVLLGVGGLVLLRRTRAGRPDASR